MSRSRLRTKIHSQPKRSAAGRLSFAIAEEPDAAAIASLLNDAATQLTTVHGRGHWSHGVSERTVLLSIRPPVRGKPRTITSQVLIARAKGGTVVGTLRLATKKPWAIQISYFTPVRRALYLTDMAVDPQLQGRGIGRRLLQHAARIARGWPTAPAPAAIRLDAYDIVQRSQKCETRSDTGAAGFYLRCGYREVARVKYRGNPLVYLELLL